MAVSPDLAPADFLISQQATYNEAHMRLSYTTYKLQLVQNLLVYEALLRP